LAPGVKRRIVLSGSPFEREGLIFLLYEEREMTHHYSEVLDHPIVHALHPRNNFITVRWLPDNLNPFAAYNIGIAALIPFASLPHIKAVPALQMMLEDSANGIYEGKHTIVIDSSGNTGHAVARLAPAFGFSEIKVVCAVDVPESKKGILAALSTVEIIEVPRGKSVSERAKEEAQKPGYCHLNQYEHMGNVRAHELYTGPHIEESLNIGLHGLVAIASSMGSGGTIAGTGRHIKKWFPSTTILGVRPKLGEQVPGARDERKMSEVVKLPWQEVVDIVVDISRKESFIAMRELWSGVEPQPGPTSGLAWAGLRSYLKSLGPERLQTLKGGRAAFICPDDGRFYTERTTGEIDSDQGLV
jgi:cysteine synthase